MAARRRRWKKPTVLPPWVVEANGPRRPQEKARYDFNDVADEWEQLGSDSKRFERDWEEVTRLRKSEKERLDRLIHELKIRNAREGR